MKYCILLPIGAAALIIAAGQMVMAQAVPFPAPVKLELEVDALSTLNDLNLTPDQLASLKQMASDTAGTLSETPDPSSEEYRDALRNLRKALLSKDEDKIDDAQDALGDVADKEDDDSDPDITQSDSAKTKAAALLKSLTVKQVAAYLSENADDVDDPTELLLDAVHQSRGMSEDDFVDLRNDTTDELRIFAGGANPTRIPTIVGKATGLLNRVHKMSDDEYASNQSDIEDQVRKLTANADPIPQLRHWMENEMADLLSNPELLHAIAEWTGAPGN